ncbi:hypothetical protein RA280_14820 [Cupriavidus sp. CV2]|uniref:hypothetical protein n=1 Tax=Cupriavidus ulmosensis TaxID=3065913 RepID=UPI00296ABE61|nr:hypothetical protein [Cupriavidus sp. CV2]MDW3682998.1 hypothetical protein [Cupriavidus sp. CV2]
MNYYEPTAAEIHALVLRAREENPNTDGDHPLDVLECLLEREGEEHDTQDLPERCGILAGKGGRYMDMFGFTEREYPSREIRTEWNFGDDYAWVDLSTLLEVIDKRDLRPAGADPIDDDDVQVQTEYGEWVPRRNLPN